MKTMRPNLTIQLNRSRKNSSLDKNGGTQSSGFMTPIDQTITTPGFPPPNPQFASQYFQPGQQISQQQQQQQQDPLDSSMVCTPVGSRNDSTFSLYSDDEVMGGETPQHSYPSQQQNTSLTRSSSVASSFAGDFTGLSVNFTKNFDNLILNIYQSYVNKPDITPFDPKYPPSGIASRVSRDVLRKSISDKISIDYNSKRTEELWQNANLSYTLTMIRKRLIELCDPHLLQYHNGSHQSGSIDETPIEMPLFLSRQPSFVLQHQLQRQNSTSSLTFSIANGINTPNLQQPQQSQQQHRPSWLHLNSSFMTHRLSSTDSLVENANFTQQQGSRSNSAHSTSGKLYNTPPSLSRWTSNDTDFEMTTSSLPCKKDDLMSQQTLFYPPQFPHNGSNNVTPPQQHFAQLEDQQSGQLESPFHPTFNLSCSTNSLLGGPNGNGSGLQSPFSEAAPIRNKSTDSNADTQDPLYNATHNRKRDSLIKKRGGR